MSLPYYQDDLVTLYHGDCLDVQTWLAADALVSDPPYGRDWKQGHLGSAKKTSNAHPGIANDHSTEVRDAALAAWGNRPAILFGDLMLAPPAGTKQVLVYAKARNAGLRGATAGFRRDAEAIYLVGKWPSGFGGDSSILTTTVLDVADGSRRFAHPHAKPIDLMAALASRTGGTIADPFAGSGSTLVAAKLLGRKAIGVELDEAHCEMAARRLANDVLDFGDWDEEETA